MAAACRVGAGACGGGRGGGAGGTSGMGGGRRGGGGGGDGGAGRGGPDGAAGGRGSGGASGGSGGGPTAGRDDVVAAAPINDFTAPRSDFRAVSVAHAGDGERVHAVEPRRDVEPGPPALPRRSRFRLAASDQQDTAAWTFAAPPDDVVSDVAVHPSGDVTIAEAANPGSLGPLGSAPSRLSR